MMVRSEFPSATQHRLPNNIASGIRRVQPGARVGGMYVTDLRRQGFLAEPPMGSGRGVLVLHAWWGLNDTVKAFCRRLAGDGFTAYAPDLYHGKTAATIADAEALASGLDARHEEVRTEMRRAMDFLRNHVARADRDLAVVGFSLGAYYALELAAAMPEDIGQVVIFYGTGSFDHSRSRAAYLGHFAEHDEYEPQSHVDELEATLAGAGRPVRFHRYPGAGHWFFEPDRTDAFDEDAAELAWERTLAFLKESAPPMSRR